MTVYQFAYACERCGRKAMGIVGMDPPPPPPRTWWQRAILWAIGPPRPTMACDDCGRSVPLTTWQEVGS